MSGPSAHHTPEHRHCGVPCEGRYAPALRRIDQGLYQNEEARLSAIAAAAEGPTARAPDLIPGNLPLADNLVVPYQAVENDLSELWSAWQTMRARLVSDDNQQRAAVAGLNTTLGSIQSLVTRYQLYASDSGNNYVWVSDSFTSTDFIDPANTTAYVDVTNAVVTLAVTALDTLAGAIASVSIDRNASVGLPGTNLVIASPGSGSLDSAHPEPAVVLEGATDSHCDITAIFDNTGSTWFDWESCYLPELQIFRRRASVQDASRTDADILAKASKTGRQRGRIPREGYP